MPWPTFKSASSDLNRAQTSPSGKIPWLKMPRLAGRKPTETAEREGRSEQIERGHINRFGAAVTTSNSNAPAGSARGAPLLKSPTYPRATIANLAPLQLPGYNQGGDLIVALRHFECDGVPCFWTVDLNTLATQIMPASQFQSRKQTDDGTPGYLTSEKFEATPYRRLLGRYSKPPTLLQNAGFTRGHSTAKQMAMSIDFCPSSRPFEREFLQLLGQRSVYFCQIYRSLRPPGPKGPGFLP